MVFKLLKNIAVLILTFFLMACQSTNWNNPYSEKIISEPVLFSSFSVRPKHLDPVVSYNANEWGIISQIYEPPLQYHYLKKPYTLEPQTLVKLPSVKFLNKAGQQVEEESDEVAFSEYHFQLLPNIRYQPHPAFVKDVEGNLTLANLSPKQLENIHGVEDFKQTATRELMAADYVYAIKRMAVRQNHSPILSSMMQYIVGLADYSNQVTQKTQKDSTFDIRTLGISGVNVLSDKSFSIRIKGRYPQFLYWMTMNFFAPVPWEAIEFYRQPGLITKNITLDTYPVGTGAYYMVENNPERRIRLQANPNYQHGFYPTEGLPDGADKDLLLDAGKQLPFVKEIVLTMEKENVPAWNKFLQGYYDVSGVSSDSFDQAISVSGTGDLSLTPQMQQQGIHFINAIEPSIYYFAFNLADPVVGGYSEKQRKLRKALSIALNFEEFISIFMSGRGIAAQGPIPPGLFGFDEGESGINPSVYGWVNGHPKRKSIKQAKQLLAEAGYPEGRDENGKPLTLYFDTSATGPDSKSQLNWYRKQFAKLGVELVIRATDYNRFQDKVRGAKTQLFMWGWNADYPDPENFLFLLDGAQASINSNGTGVNSANYDNPEYNRLYKKIKTMKNTPKRKALIDQMVSLVREDAPWAFGFHPKSLQLYHSWYHNAWPNPLANNTLKYKRVDAAERTQKQAEWNTPVYWPIILVLVAIMGLYYPLRKAYRQRQTAVIKTQQERKC